MIVIKSLKEKLLSYVLEIILILSVAIASFIWQLHITNAEQDLTNVKQQISIEINAEKIQKIEAYIESFRKENREDHKEILDFIRRTEKK